MWFAHFIQQQQEVERLKMQNLQLLKRVRYLEATPAQRELMVTAQNHTSGDPSLMVLSPYTGNHTAWVIE